jgi:hypothetical protein
MGLTQGFAWRVAEAAFDAARDFFQLSPEWQIDFYADDLEDEGSRAEIRTEQRYLRVEIVYDATQFDSGADLWETIGHEVAHMVLNEYDAIEATLPNHLRHWFTHANERAVVRLERLFKRERPYPGDEAFKEMKP